MLRIIFDCDLGTDDAIALYFLLLAERDCRVKIEMIVCSKGNTSLPNVCRNVVRLLEVAGRTDIPIYCGAYETLLPRSETIAFYHGADGFGDLQHATEPNTSIIRPEPAFQAMRDLILANPNQITYVCVGPMTNCALLMRMYDPDEVLAKIAALHIMGGNHFGVGNASQAAEFNFHSDPEAAHISLTCARCPIHLLTWECCYSTTIPMMWRMETLTKNGGPTWQLIDRAERAIYTDMNENWLPCDAFLIAAMLYPEIITKQTMRHVDVELAGRLTRGQAAIDHMNTKCPNVNVIEKIDCDFFRKLIVEAHTKL